MHACLPSTTQVCIDRFAVQVPGKKNCCIKCLAGLLIVVGLAFALSLPLIPICMLLKHNREWREAASNMELLQNNTILTYQGNSSSVQFSARVETDLTGETPPQFNISLISVNCDELFPHKSYLSISNLPVLFSTERPVMLPPGYNHYELLSTFQYSITLVGASNTSEVAMLIFNNTVDADNYISHHTDQSLQNKAVLNRKFSTNKSTPVSFHPSEGKLLRHNLCGKGWYKRHHLV